MEFNKSNYIVDSYSENVYKVAIITGASRSGKTILGLELARGKYVDHLEDDWINIILTVSSGLGKIDSTFAKQLLCSYTNEKVNDAVLLRNANFRPEDQTSIWKLKDPEDIFRRLLVVKSRKDVTEFLTDNDYLLLLNLPTILPFVHFLFDVYLGLKVIHVVRNGISVAKEIEKKEWWSDESLNLRRVSTLYRTVKINGNMVNIPWWVHEGEEKFFSELDGFSRGLYSWVMNFDFNSKNSHDSYQNKYIKIIRFEDLLGNNTSKIFEDACDYLSISDQFQMEESVARLKNIKMTVTERGNLDIVPDELKRRVMPWLEKFGYI